jgi:hypothetical protein
MDIWFVVVVVLVVAVALGGGVRINTGNISIFSKHEGGHQKDKR